jgi:hypothetical protein
MALTLLAAVMAGAGFGSPDGVVAAPDGTPGSAVSAAATVAAPGTNGDAAPASADSLAAPDSTAGGLGAALLVARQNTGALTGTPNQPFLVSWTREPKVGMSAKVRLVSYYGNFNNNLVLEQGASVSQQASYSSEDYRKQDKTVEKRDGSLLFRGGQSLPVETQIRMNWNWSEDRTVNSAARANVNRRDFKQALLSATKSDLETGPVTHSIALTGSLDDQRGENQRQRNDFSEGRLDGALRSRAEPVTGVALATSLYRQHSAGNRALAGLTSPSSADTDSLTGGVFWDRGRLSGSFTVRNSSFRKRYLDYNRNANNLIDTISPGVRKVVEELERQDAVSLEWTNRLRWGRLGLGADLARDLDEQNYRASGAGLREKHQDHVNLDASFRYARQDSVRLTYGYQWFWDDQTYKGATSPRGRQIAKRRDVDLTVQHWLFRHTGLTFKQNINLSQDIAQREFNDNDRDRYEMNSSVKLATDWTGRFRTNMIFTYRHIEDISIRANRSSNNNDKDTYEITPGYVWPLAAWLDLQQDFRISIEFTDYVFSDLPSVSRQDEYNKRGNLKTRVTLRPSPRLSLTISHDYNARFNATRSRTDAAGNDFYRKDVEQRISTIDFALTYKATDWLKLEGASYRTKDLKEQLGSAAVNETDTRSGEVWIGGTVNKTWGQKNSMVLAASARRYDAFGPNVQRDVNDRFWDADLSFTWKF